MNVCTFVGKLDNISVWDNFTEVFIRVAENYTNSRGENKTEYTTVVGRAYSTAGEYLAKNARRGDNIAVRAMFKSGAEPRHYFRINEFKIIKD